MALEKIKFKKIIVGELQANSYILFTDNSEKCLIIDPGDEAHKLTKFIKNTGLNPAGIILTHGHFDHCAATKELKSLYEIPIMIHKDDRDLLKSPLYVELANLLNISIPPEADLLLKDDETIIEGGIELKVIHTPGHTQGSICLKSSGNLLFTGDTLFKGSIGRSDLQESDSNKLKKSLNILKQFPPDTIILPGHGESSTIKQEIELNPFLKF